MLDHRLRRWPTIKSTLAQRLVICQVASWSLLIHSHCRAALATLKIEQSNELCVATHVYDSFKCLIYICILLDHIWPIISQAISIHVLAKSLRK